MSIATQATSLAITLTAICTGVTCAPELLQLPVVANVAQLAQVQELAIAGDGKYPDRLGSLENSIYAADIAQVFGEACDHGGQNFFDLIPVDGYPVSYTLNVERTHYVLARQFKDGSVVAISDDKSEPIICETYGECLAQLTDDEDLRNSAPVWQTI